MTPLEERLRAAFEAQAGRLRLDHPVPGHPRLPGARETRASAGRRGRRGRWIAAASVAATVAVLVAVTVVARRERPGTVVAGTPTTTASGPAGLPKVAIPSAAGPRPYLADVPSVSEQRIERAAIVFGTGAGDHWTVFVGDAASGDLRAIVDLPKPALYDVSADGVSVAFATPLDGGGTVLGVIDVRDGTASAFRAEKGPPRAVAISPSGDYLALLTEDSLTLTTRTGALVTEARGIRSDQGMELGWSPSGSAVAVLRCGVPGECHGAVVNVAHPAYARTNRPVEWLGWIDDERLVAARAGGGVVVTDRTGAVQKDVAGPWQPVDRTSVSPDRRSIAARLNSGGIGTPFAEVVDLQSGAVVRPLQTPSTGIPYLLGWRGTHLLAAREVPGRYEIVQFDDAVSTGTVLFTLPFRTEDFGPDSSTVRVAGWFAAGR